MQLTDQQLTHFQTDGYLVLEQLFDAEEMDLLLKIGRADQATAADYAALEPLAAAASG